MLEAIDKVKLEFEVAGIGIEVVGSSKRIWEWEIPAADMMVSKSYYRISDY